MQRGKPIFSRLPRYRLFCDVSLALLPCFLVALTQRVDGRQPVVLLPEFFDDALVAAGDGFLQPFHILAGQTEEPNGGSVEQKGTFIKHRLPAQIGQKMRKFALHHLNGKLRAIFIDETLLPVERVVHQLPVGNALVPLLAEEVDAKIQPELSRSPSSRRRCAENSLKENTSSPKPSSPSSLSIHTHVLGAAAIIA